MKSECIPGVAFRAAHFSLTRQLKTTAFFRNLCFVPLSAIRSYATFYMLSECLFSEVRRWAESSALLHEVSPHAQRVVQSCMVASFFRVEGSRGFTLTRAGSRPGDALADLLSAFIMQDMLAEVRSSLADLPDPVCQHAGLVDPTCADDLALPFIATSCLGLLAAARRTSQAVHQSMVHRAMAPNYSRGKTELLFNLRGVHSQEVRKQMFVSKMGLLDFTFGSDTFLVHCVNAYSHLGGVLHASGKSLPDILQKTAVSIAAVRPLASPALRNPCLPWQRRVQVLHSLTAATWYPLNCAETRAFARAVTSASSLGLDRLASLLLEDAPQADDSWLT